LVIAVDGPAGAGKSTIAKKIAKELGIYYLDTGAMYRAFTLHVLNKNIDLHKQEELKKCLKNFHLEITEDCVRVDGKDVTKEIRRDKVTRNVSYISSLDFVRKKMVELQREIGKNRDIIAEGRDIGSVVFPDANHKFYLDATIEERALRRINDEKNLKTVFKLPVMMDEIQKRDAYDSTRKNSPLKKACGAVYIDSTDMTIDEVCYFIIKKVKEHKEQ
jgi:cytidylate kinase